MTQENLDQLLKKLLEPNPGILTNVAHRDFKKVYELFGVYFPKPNRDLKKHEFVECARDILQYNQQLIELFFTSHTPIRYADRDFLKLPREEQRRQEKRTGYRLWLTRPDVLPQGYPDWGCQQGIALAEMWTERNKNPDTDHEIFQRITYRAPSPNEIEIVKSDPKILYSHSGIKSPEVRIYRLK